MDAVTKVKTRFKALLMYTALGKTRDRCKNAASIELNEQLWLGF